MPMTSKTVSRHEFTYEKEFIITFGESGSNVSVFHIPTWVLEASNACRGIQHMLKYIHVKAVISHMS